MSGQAVAPNLFQLSGHQVHVNYTTTGIDGKPHFMYQDAQQTKSFSGDEIRAVECDLGMLISVTIHLTVDMGSTSFSVFIPRMQIEQGTTAAIHTDGVTTMHRFSIVPAFNRGQLDSYAVKALDGTAQHVVF